MIRYKKSVLYLTGAILLTFSCILCINLYIVAFSQSLLFHGESKTFGIVLGARVRGQYPSDVLKDRLDSAYELYIQKKIEKILVTGDNSTKGYDETTVMQKYLIERGVLTSDIFMDFAGFDTYDSLYRAKRIFSIDDAIVFTQQFHLARSIYIGKKLGIDVIGYASDRQTYIKIRAFTVREILARVKAFFDVAILHSQPKFLGEKVRG